MRSHVVGVDRCRLFGKRTVGKVRRRIKVSDRINKKKTDLEERRACHLPCLSFGDDR